MKLNLIFLFFSILGAQWFEGSLYLPDSFSGTCKNDAIVWNSIDDKIFLIGFNETFVSINCETDEKSQPIRINGNEGSHPDWLEWNRANNCLYIWCTPYCSYSDSLFIVACQTRQTVNIISFPRNAFQNYNQAQMCASPTSNKVYLIKENYPLSLSDTFIYVIDGYTHQVTKRIKLVAICPFINSYPSMKWNSVNNCIYLLGYIPGTDSTGLAIIDCARDTVISVIRISPLNVTANCFGLDTLRNRLYISIHNTMYLTIYEIDCNTNSIIQTININNTSEWRMEFVVNAEERKIYYSRHNSWTFVYILDITSGLLEDSIPVFPDSRTSLFLNYYPPNHELYCISSADLNDTLAIINLSNHSVDYYEMQDYGGSSVRPFLHLSRGKLYLSPPYGEIIEVFDCTNHIFTKFILHGTQLVNDILLNPIEHKLYCITNYRPYVFVFDSENLRAIHQPQVAPKGYGLACLGFAHRQNKVYISYPRHITVLNSHTDSIIKVIEGLISYYKFAYNPIMDKLYTLDISLFGSSRTSYVIDCATDSVVKILQTTQAHASGDIEFDSLTNKVYMTGDIGGMVVIDCWNDSVIKRDSTIRGGNICFRSHGDRRVYAKNGMFDRFTDSLIGYLPYTVGNSEYNAINDLLYLSGDKIYVIDCINNNLVDSIITPWSVNSMFWNKLNNKLYTSSLDPNTWYEPLIIADCRTNQIIATFPQTSRTRFWERCFDPSNNRFFVDVNRGSRLGMIRDNIGGIEELKKGRGELKVYPTLGKRFSIETDEGNVVKIYNALGERVTKLYSNKQGFAIWDGNDMRGNKLNNGIYFITKDTRGCITTIKKLVLFY